jgi:YidC/Oxa1 family membrane protein insertase
MNDIRRSILWVIFGFSLILIWDRWQIHNGNQPLFFPASASAPAASAPQATGTTVTSAGAVPSAAAPATVEGAGAPAVTTAPTVTHEVTTDVFKLTFSSEGGTLVGAELLKHAAATGSSKDQTARPFPLLEQNANRTYIAQTGLAGGPFPTHKTPMSLVKGGKALADGSDTLELRFESEPVGGVVLAKTYTLTRGSYVVGVKHEVINRGEQPVKPQLYMQLVRDGGKIDNETPFYSTFTGPAVYSSVNKYEKVEFADIEKNKATFTKQVNDGYVAMVQHYFASAWLPAEGAARHNYVEKVPGANNLYRAGSLLDAVSVPPGQMVTLDKRLFVGPQEEKSMEQITPGLELVKDYGWLTILAKPLYWLMEKIYTLVVPNWGWAIVLLVVIIKAAFYWLNASAYRSMAKMKAINPRIMEMRERLKNNPQQMQQEMMKMYRDEKVNPLGGCFPILIQIPVFIALYWVLLSSVEMRNAPWVGWITDLSSPDPFFVLPLIMTLTTVIQTALNPLPPDPLQAKLMWMMPLVFSVMFFFFPAGLVLYWITNNVLTIAQQAYINNKMGVPLKFSMPSFK